MITLRGSRRNQQTARDRKQMALVGQIDRCVLCESTEALQVSHCPSAYGGKAFGLKGHPALLARLCMKCHNDIDMHRGEWEKDWAIACNLTTGLIYDMEGRE